MPGRRGLFIAGTDTGVGKTTVAVGLLRLALQKGLVPIPCKPVETGCDPEPSDARRLWQAARAPTTLAETCPCPLALPVAPAAAAAAEGRRLAIADVASHAESLACRGDLIIVEGAGGLLAPYCDEPPWTNADLAAMLGLPILVIGRMALGTINHTSLTLGELRRRGLFVAGVVLVRTDAASGPHEATNARLIERVSGVQPLGTLPFLSVAEREEPDQIASSLEQALSPAVIERLLG